MIKLVNSAVGLFLFSVFLHVAPAASASEGGTAVTFSVAEVESLVQPIALYPDVLIQTMLPAATFPDQIVDAALLIKTKEDAAKIKDQTWDTSVKLVATYPGILKSMFEKLDWTTALGQAYLNQHRDVLDAIQRARGAAKKAGELESNKQQEVVTSTSPTGTTVIQIQPTNPEVVYVPSSTVVYTNNTYSSSSALVPVATFGLGVALGAALADDDDDDVNVYYGHGGGYWYNDDHFDQWQDNRRAAWEDHNDRAWDRQDHRQEMSSNRQDFRQDAYKDGSWKGPSSENKAAAQQRADQRKQSAQQRSTQASQSAQTRRTQTQQTAQQRSQQRQASAQSRGWSSGSSSSQSGAYGNYGSRSSTSKYSSRGSTSRSMSSGSRMASSRRSGGGGRRR